jgi:hypothetical protein
MIAPICVGRRSLRVRRRADRPGNEAEVRARLRTLLIDARSQFTLTLRSLRELADTKADPNPAGELRTIARRRRFNRQLTDDLMRSLDEDEAGPPGDTRYDVLQALSRVATHGTLSRRQQYELSRYSGVYSQGEHFRECPYCKSILIGRQPVESAN